MGALKILFWLAVALTVAFLGLWFQANSTTAERQDIAGLRRQPDDAPLLALNTERYKGGVPASLINLSVTGSPAGATLASASQATAFNFERVIVSPVVTNFLPEQVVVADVTGDGLNDVVLAIDAWEDVVLRVHAQKADGTLADPAEFRLPIMATSGGAGGSVEVADLNNDGLPEIVLALGNGVAVFQKSSIGFSYRTFTGNVRALSLGAIDLDGDGHRDIFAQGWDEGADIYLSDGRGGFRSVQRISTPLGGYNTLEISDFTADGIADVVMTNGQGWSKVFVYPAVASGGLQSLIELPLPSVQTSPPFGMTVADMDRDGRPDLIVSDEGNALTPLRGIHIYYRGEGNSIGRHQFLQFQNIYQRPGAVQVADVDGNGYPDIVAMLNSNDQMVYILQGSSGFSEPVFQSTDNNPWSNNHYLDNSFTIADINSDGCPDIVLAELSSSLRVFYGRNCQLPTRRTGGPLPPRLR